MQKDIPRGKQKASSYYKGKAKDPKNKTKKTNSAIKGAQIRESHRRPGIKTREEIKI